MVLQPLIQGLFQISAWTFTKKEKYKLMSGNCYWVPGILVTIPNSWNLHSARDPEEGRTGQNDEWVLLV